MPQCLPSCNAWTVSCYTHRRKLAFSSNAWNSLTWEDRSQCLVKSVPRTVGPILQLLQWWQEKMGKLNQCEPISRKSRMPIPSFNRLSSSLSGGEGWQISRRKYLLENFCRFQIIRLGRRQLNWDSSAATRQKFNELLRKQMAFGTEPGGAGISAKWENYCESHKFEPLSYWRAHGWRPAPLLTHLVA